MNTDPNNKSPFDISIVEQPLGAPDPFRRLSRFKSGIMLDGTANHVSSAILLELSFDDGKSSSGNIIVRPEFALKLAQSLLRAHGEATQPDENTQQAIVAALKAHQRKPDHPT